MNKWKDDDDLNTNLAPFRTEAEGITNQVRALIRMRSDGSIKLTDSLMGNCPSSVTGQSASSVESCFGSSVESAGDHLIDDQTASK